MKNEGIQDHMCPVRDSNWESPSCHLESLLISQFFLARYSASLHTKCLQITSLSHTRKVQCL